MMQSDSPKRRKSAVKPPTANGSPDADDPQSVRPPLTLVLGPSGAGKTQTVLARFMDNGGRALLVVPSPLQADTCAHRIAARLGKPTADVRGAVTTFHGLTTAIHRAAREDGIRTI